MIGRDPHFEKMRNDVRQRLCPVCKKTFVREPGSKGWRDHFKHVNGCMKKGKA